LNDLLASPDSCWGDGSLFSITISFTILLLWYKTIRSRFWPGTRVG
jgi:hypothetical protein